LSAQFSDSSSPFLSIFSSFSTLAFIFIVMSWIFQSLVSRASSPCPKFNWVLHRPGVSLKPSISLAFLSCLLFMVS
jgi:hypothetical protein